MTDNVDVRMTTTEDQVIFTLKNHAPGDVEYVANFLSVGMDVLAKSGEADPTVIDEPDAPLGDDFADELHD